MNYIHEWLALNTISVTAIAQNGTDSSPTFVPSQTDIANLVVGIIALCLFLALVPLLATLVIGRRAWRFVHLFCGYKLVGNRYADPRACCWPQEEINKPGDVQPLTQRLKAKLKHQRWMHLMVMLVFFFALVRVITTVIIVVQFGLMVGGQYDASMRLRTVRHLFDNISLHYYIVCYLFVLPVWLQIVQYFFSLQRQNKRRMAVKVITYVFVVLMNIAAFVVFIPLSIFPIIGLAGTTDYYLNTIEEHWKKPYLYYFGLEVECIILAAITLYCIVFVVLVIIIIRQTIHKPPRGMKMSNAQLESLREKRLKRLWAVLKLSTGMIFFTICVGIRILGFFLYFINNLPSWVTNLLIFTLPDVFFLFAVVLIFWPFKLPACCGSFGQPVQAEQEEPPKVFSVRITDQKETIVEVYDDEEQEWDKPENLPRTLRSGTVLAPERPPPGEIPRFVKRAFGNNGARSQLVDSPGTPTSQTDSR